jgi:hypothetical protein
MSSPLRTTLLTALGVMVGCTGAPDPIIKTDDTGADEVDPSTPWVTIHLPDGGAVITEGSSVTLGATVNNIESDLTEVMVVWTSASGSELCGGSAPSEYVDDSTANASCSFSVSRGDSPVTLTATHGELISTAQVDLVIRTADAPTVTIEAPTDGGYVNEGESFTIEATVSDDNDAPNSLALMLQSDLDGTVFTGAADPSGDFSYIVADLSLGDHTLTLSATDRDGFVGEATIAFEVNSPPGDPVIHLEPSDPGADDDISVVIDTDAPDADGDALTYRYTWFVDGAVATGYVDATVPASATLKGETWMVEVQAADGRSVGGIVSDSIEVVNTAPELDTVSITPDPASVADDLTCEVGTSVDVDGDDITYTYSWQIAGVVRPETEAMLPAGTAFLGNSVVCTVVPTDGEDAGVAVRSATVVISNAVPTAPVVSVSPDISDPGSSDLVCAIDNASFDADTDAVTYLFEWTADGLIYPDDYSSATGPSTDTDTDDTIPAADTLLAEEWTCSVTPNDGTVDGSPGRADAIAAVLADYGDGVDATGSTVAHDSSTVFAQEITLAADITVTGFGIGVDTLASSGTDATIGLYSDSGAGPGSLLVSSDLETLSSGDNDLDSTTWTAVTAGTYWIVVNYDASDDTTITADSTITATVYTESDGGSSDLPSSWSGTTTATESLYAWWLVGY